MASDGTTNIRNHGIEFDPKKKRVRCNYCEKVISGFHRLKCHLGGIKGDVVSCAKVPNEVKDLFEKEITEKKMKKLQEKDENQYHPELRSKRKLSLQRENADNNERDVRINRFEGQYSLEGDCLQEIRQAKEIASSKLGNNSAEDSSTIEFRRSLYDMGNNFITDELPEFLKMISTLSNGQTAYNNLDCQGLKGYLDYTLIPMQQCVNDLKETWETTGCSILLDDWIDSKDQILINVLVSCPKGVIYLKSSNISTLVGNVDAMVAFVEEVIQEVGVENVVQIITNSTLAMKEVGKKIRKKHKHLFCTMSASSCIELMLKKFRKMRLVKRVFEKARIILKFIHNHAATLETFCPPTSVHNLVKRCKLKSFVPYLTLESVVEKKEILKNLFASSDWRASNLSTSSDGKSVADLVKGSAFWGDANVVVKASVPLLNVVHLLCENNYPQTGYIYETIDQAKIAIKDELKHEFLYKPFWKEIDEIWDFKLHSSIHSAGYFFNPTFFYSNNFDSSLEVVSGMVCCITGMTRDSHVKSLVRLQFHELIARKRMSHTSAMDVPKNCSPAHWWLTNGGEFPELQKIVVRILNQTCDGASKFDLKKDLAEMQLADERNPIGRRMLKDLAFVYYNMQLQKFDSNISRMVSIDKNDQLNDWRIFDEEQ